MLKTTTNQIPMFEPIKSNDWFWHFKDYAKAKPNGLNVLSAFACGGGSTMGYKLAGCDVIGNIEIDPKINKIYVLNHKPKYNYLMDIRDFNKIKTETLPKELQDLDILDASPPCTTFSICGLREETWGKEKQFKEGQTKQVLDTLLFETIKTIEKLKPKVAIIENVKGLIMGNAWAYVQEIYKQLNAIGYRCKHWLLKGEQMGVPQTRHRVFFIATRLPKNKLDLDKINLGFNYAPITFAEIKKGVGHIDLSKTRYQLLKKAIPTDKSIKDTKIRLGMKGNCFSLRIVWNEDIMPTLCAKNDNLRGNEQTRLSIQDLINASTFPQDYNFKKNTYAHVAYIVGMSVPPIMIKRIVERLLQVWNRTEQKEVA